MVGAAVGEGEGEEAEYAWLQADSLKPFSAGDTSGNPDGVLSGDGTLQACVAAADRTLQVWQHSGYHHDRHRALCELLWHQAADRVITSPLLVLLHTCAFCLQASYDCILISDCHHPRPSVECSASSV